MSSEPKLEVVENEDAREAPDAGEDLDTSEDLSGKTVYLLELKNGNQRRLTVPSNWTVTFGPTVPFEAKSGGRYDNCWALRLYEGSTKSKLRAIFTDVVSFRDMGIKVLEKQVRVKRSTIQKASHKGGKSVEVEARMEAWVDPDEPESMKIEPDFTKLEFKPEDIESMEF